MAWCNQPHKRILTFGRYFFGNRMVFVPRGTQVAVLLSDGTEVECFVRVFGYTPEIRWSIIYTCAFFSLCVCTTDCCLKASGEVGPLKMVRVLLYALIGVGCLSWF
jgi:hypothetical protein